MVSFKEMYLNYPKTKLNDLFYEVCTNLENSQLIGSASNVIFELKNREKISSTLFENEVGIPHASCKDVKESTLILVTSKDGIVYNDGRTARLVIFLLTPVGSDNNHLNMMSELSRILLSNTIVKKIVMSKQKEEITEIFSYNQEFKPKEAISKNTILAITACTTGIAHTYIAANALEKAAAEEGVEIFVERQGANGIEKQIPEKAIKRADGIIIAADVKVKGIERFIELPVLKTNVSAPIENSKKLLDEVLKAKEILKNPNEEKKTDTIIDTLLTSFSRIIPLLLLAIIGIELCEYISIFSDYQSLFNTLLYISIPIFCADLGSNLTDKRFNPAGLLIGFLCTPMLMNISEPPHVFLAVIMVFIFSKLEKTLHNKLKTPEVILPIRVHLINPMLIICSILLFYNFVVKNFIELFALLYSSVPIISLTIIRIILTTGVVIGICFDYGGRINKMTNLFAIGLAFGEILPMTACNLAIVIPPIGVALLKFFDYKNELFNGNVYDNSFKLFFRGMLAISEGVKPFLKDYRKIIWPVNIFGTLVGVFVANILGATAYYPIPAFWGWIFIDNVYAYIIGLMIGITLIAVLNYILIKIIYGRETE
ncbi:MAG: fructose PTS transporter subunit IIB [Anaerocolumna sp.]